MKPPYEAIVVHGAGLTPQETLPPAAISRMNTAISKWRLGTAPWLVVSGNHSFMADVPPSVTEASAMEDFALGEGVPVNHILKEEHSLDTVGNALFTKSDILVPRGLSRIAVVTSASHLPRATGIFRHVLGGDFDVVGVPAPEDITLKTRAYEFVGDLMVKEILRGTKPGDDEAIRERLFDLVPGYAEGSPATKARLALRSLTGLLKPRTMLTQEA